MSVTILLPTYNEEENITQMINSVKHVSRNFKIVVVDSGSKDKTQQLARKKGAKVIVIRKRGKGLAVKHALQQVHSDYVIILDSDLTYPASEIPKLIAMLKNKKCDVVLGSRFKGKIEHGAMTPINKFGNKFLTLLAHLTYFRHVSDVCSGMWGFTRKAYKKMIIDAPHFELEANFFVQCIKNNFRLCEVPIAYKKRGGKTKLSIVDGLKIAGYLIRKRF